MDYLLDSDVFIQAKNFHYGFDFCPAFWMWLMENNRSGRVASIEAVSIELRKGDDDLVKWVTDQSEAFFIKFNEAVMKKSHIVSD